MTEKGGWAWGAFGSKIQLDTRVDDFEEGSRKSHCWRLFEQFEPIVQHLLYSKEPLAFALSHCGWEEEIKKVSTVGSKNYTKKEHY